MSDTPEQQPKRTPNFKASPPFTEEQKAELVPKIAELRADGYTWKEIGEKLGHNYQRLRSMHRKHPDGKYATVEEVGVKERLFAKKLIEGEKTKDAARAVGESKKWATETMESPDFKNYLFRRLQAAGLTEELVMEEHRSLIKATRTVVATHKGEITDQIEVPDNTARMTAIRTAYELYGHIGGKGESASSPSINISLTVTEKEQIEGLVGMPLNVNVIPAEVIEAPAEPVEP